MLRKNKIAVAVVTVIVGIGAVFCRKTFGKRLHERTVRRRKNARVFSSHDSASRGETPDKNPVLVQFFGLIDFLGQLRKLYGMHNR